MTASSETMCDKPQREFPNKLPGPEYKMEIYWVHAIPLVLGHFVGIYALWLVEKPLLSGIYVYFMSLLGLFGVNVSAHRLFTHRTFKANTPLKALLIVFQTLSMQRSLYTWVHHHRLHHKYMDTNADPHNARRGLFFSHIGWLMVKPHPDVEKFADTIDISDLENDPLVMFQYRNYVSMVVAMVVITTLTPWLCWGESLKASLFFAFLWQYGVCMHVTWCVNSLAHRIGSRKFDASLSATDFKLLSFFATGEGFHNYHHAFPWDYKAAELGNYSLNFSKAFIDFMAKIGWATDMKTASAELVRKRMIRTGVLNNNVELEESQVWGWDDPEMRDEEKKLAFVLNRTVPKL